jgi:hypothetical protein
MTFTLNIPLSQDDVNQINGLGQTITITQSNPTASTTQAPVAWVAFSPFEANLVTWEAPVAIYASDALVESGVQIFQESTTPYPATPGVLYPFSGGAFQPAVPNDGAKGTYYTQNNSGGTLTFGLTQTCMRNGAVLGGGPAPLSISSVGNTEEESFVVEANIWVYLSDVTNNGTVISSVTSSALALTMQDDNPVELEFDATSNTFQINDNARQLAARR